MKTTKIMINIEHYRNPIEFENNKRCHFDKITESLLSVDLSVTQYFGASVNQKTFDDGSIDSCCGLLCNIEAYVIKIKLTQTTRLSDHGRQ